MREINELVRTFDDRITLSADRLYERFGLENGGELLRPYFDDVQTVIYEDSLLVDVPEPLIEYILSCHGNQNQYILDRYKEFRQFVEKKQERGFHITKEAGILSVLREILDLQIYDTIRAGLTCKHSNNMIEL